MRNSFFTAIAALIFALPSQAGIVTWDFTGNFASTDYGPHGTTMAGSISFNTDTIQATALSFVVSGYPGDVTY